MARLTYRDESGKAWAKLSTSATAEESMKFGRLSLDCLAAYEDTGLEPGEIQEAVNLFPRKDADIPTELKNWVERCTWHVKKCNELRKELNVYQALGTVEELAELVKAKQDGRCVVLPCKVGDTIYRVAYDCAGGIKYNPFNEHGVSYAEPCLKCNTYPCDIHKAIYEIKAVSSIWIMENAKNGNFGTKYFLTHEEAEAALKEDKDGN